uniref:2-C-methyl-D-erythritol 4-phosphate cytidylyltransferase n=1 Tax=Campylobacter coli TaxID=195 RepID=UPI00366EFF20
MRKNIAVILAGGSGSRFGLNFPKQFAKLAGKTIIEHTIETFEKHPCIDEICIVIKSGFRDKINELILKNQYYKVKKVINGGEERKDSSFNAVLAYDNENVNLIFHDAVRPFVSNKIVDGVIEALQQYNAIDVAIPSTDTIIEVCSNNIKSIPPRKFMMQGQTPQAFKLETIKKAYELAIRDSNFTPTDDCGIVKKYLPDEKIYVVSGELKNIKITHMQDLAMADKIFQFNNISNNDQYSYEYYNQNLQNKTIVVFGGSYGIGFDIASIARQYGANVESFSRSSTNTNVASISDIERDLKYVAQKYGKIDFVVNTASILIHQPLEAVEYNKILEIVNINYIGAINVAKLSLPFLEKTSGQLLNFASSSYTRGRSGYSLYSSSKAAVVNLTQALAEEFMIRNKVKINCINPQRTLTPMRVSNFGKEDPDTLLKSMDVAYVAINTLLSDFTGQIVDVVLKK